MVKVRPAALADLDGLARLFDAYRIFYAQPSDLAGARAFLGERMAHRQSVILLAQDEADNALGFAQLYPSFTSVAMQPILILNDLFVVPEARGQGVGRALLHAAADHGRAVGAARLTLKTAIDNLAAQRVYEANGWTRETQFLSYNLPLA
ncbi:MAG TPA: GNAT family N-acetyltransferase [Sphingobium sp.]|nr:GNAT family N-acetyltransferase [Sphingobium sp.]